MSEEAAGIILGLWFGTGIMVIIFLALYAYMKWNKEL